MGKNLINRPLVQVAFSLACLNLCPAHADSSNWILVENFQQFSDGDVFADASDIGWNAATSDNSEEYLMLADPHDPENVSMFLDVDNELEGWGNVFAVKALPGGGVAPGDTDTIFFRYLSYGDDNFFHAGTADKPLSFKSATGDMAEPGSWGDFNALIRTVNDGRFELRDGGDFISPDPAVTFDDLAWYYFWMVIRNSFDGTTSTGSYALYIQGPDDEEPVLIPVPSSPAREYARFRRDPIDESGNPRNIAWFMLATTSGHWENPSAGDTFLLDDIYFSHGKNLSLPQLSEEVVPELLAPSGLRATIVSDSRILLSWKDHSRYESGYKVFLQIGEEGEWTELDEVPIENLCGYNVENLDALLDYRFKVQSYAADSESEFSNVAIPNRINPIWLEAEVDEEGWMKMEWFGRFSELDPDWIYYEELGHFYTIGEDASSFWFYSQMMSSWFWTTETVFPFVYKYGANSGWYYYFRGAVAVNRWFARMPDKTFVLAEEINEAPPEPLAPLDLRAELISQSRISLSWKDNDASEFGCKIFMKAGSDGEWTKIADIPTADLTRYDIFPIDSRIENSFKVQVYNDIADSPFSEVVIVNPSSNYTLHWNLMDDFQQYTDGQVFADASDIGWHAASLSGTDEYWMLGDPFVADNVGMYVESGNYGVSYGTVFCQKELPGGGIPPAGTGTIFWRCLWTGFDNSWNIGTADKARVVDDITGMQIAPGVWGDYNALVRLEVDQNIVHRDGGGYIPTNPPQILDENLWYSFWMVVENSWDVGTHPTSTGVYTLYIAGPGFGDGVNPVLIPVGTDPPRATAHFRRAPVDALGNPQSIIWFMLETDSGSPAAPNAGDHFLIDDIYYSVGENLNVPEF